MSKTPLYNYNTTLKFLRQDTRKVKLINHRQHSFNYRSYQGGWEQKFFETRKRAKSHNVTTDDSHSLGYCLRTKLRLTDSLTARKPWHIQRRVVPSRQMYANPFSWFLSGAQNDTFSIVWSTIMLWRESSFKMISKYKAATCGK